MRLSYGHGLPCMNTVAAPRSVMMLALPGHDREAVRCVRDSTRAREAAQQLVAGERRLLGFGGRPRLPADQQEPSDRHREARHPGAFARHRSSIRPTMEIIAAHVQGVEV